MVRGLMGWIVVGRGVERGGCGKLGMGLRGAWLGGVWGGVVSRGCDNG